MINTFDDIINIAIEIGPKTLTVAAAQDEAVLKAVHYAYSKGIINPILVGNKEAIEKIGKNIGMAISKFRIINVIDKFDACRCAVKLIHDGEASMLMKGFVDTSLILKAVLDKKIGLMTGNLLSHVGVLSVPGFDRLFILSDSAMNITPTLDEKVQIINNAVKVAHALGNKMPKVALVCPVEKVNPKIPATVDAEQLTKMNIRDEIKGCIVGGPFGIDNAVSLEAARHKKINHTVAGNADILILPDITSANVLNKSMEYFAKAEKAGIIMGANSPIVLTSRASSEISKLNSIALSVLAANVK